jgi:NTE family protein
VPLKVPQFIKRKRSRIGLALGGGGARGVSHLGVLRVLEQEKIPVDLIVGTSIGALFGGAYASGTNPDALAEMLDAYLSSPEFHSSTIKAIEAAYTREEVGLKQKIQRFLKNRFFAVQALFKPGILSDEDFQPIINHLIPDIQIEETAIPFRAVATDLTSGERIVFSQGPLRQAVMASCAVPGALEPYREGEMLLADGGIICLVPCSVARHEGADIVIAVAVGRDIYSADEFRTAMGVYVRASEIMSHTLKEYELMDADVIIRPKVGNLHWSEFSQAGSLVEEGERAALEHLDAIRRVIRGSKRRSTIKRLFNRVAKSVRDA